MSIYSLGQTVYFITNTGYLSNTPEVVTFLIAAIRQTATGFEYSMYLEPASPYIIESQLFATIADAVAAQVVLLEALIPTP